MGESLPGSGEWTTVTSVLKLRMTSGRERRIISCRRRRTVHQISEALKLATAAAPSVILLLLVCIVSLSLDESVKCAAAAAAATTYQSGQDLQVAPLLEPPGPLWLHQTVSTGAKQRDEDNNSNDVNDQTVMSTKLTELLTDRIGPNVRASSNYHDFQDIGLNETLEAWVLFRKQVASFAKDQVHFYAPQLNRIAAISNVSQLCLSSLEQFLLSAERLDSWAVQMYSASGNFPPAGLFDGHFTDLGSYRGCVDIQKPKSMDSILLNKTNRVAANDNNSSPVKREEEEVKLTYAASYCLVGFRPILPSRRRFHQIFEQEDASLTRLFEPGDTFHSIANWAQYFHYLYMKTGVCVPVECSASDIQQVARQIGLKLALQPAPVRCFTRANLPSTKVQSEVELGQIDNKPVQVSISKNLTNKQLISLIIVGAFFSLVTAATLWHFCDLAYEFLQTTSLASSCSGARCVGGASCASPSSQDDIHDEEANYGRSMDSNNNNSNDNNASSSKSRELKSGKIDGQTYSMEQQQQACWLPKYVAFYYFSMITNGREFMDTSVRSNEIKCLHGLRVVTMIWIIWVHTLQYNDWSGFSRAFESAASLRNPLVHPLVNANYVVDNFFLMSGLLAAYTIWYNNKGGSSNFSTLQCFIGRYLRLTPQVLLVSLLYILLPLLGDGPFWFDVIHLAAKECEQNWWINLLHIQSFYKSDQMCNLVGWWISVDMFYYVLALGLLWMILNKHIKRALICTILMVSYCTIVTAWRHYSGGFEPNNLATVPQIGEVWTEFVVEFFWSPYPHAFVFFLGLWLGYVLANKKWFHQIRRWSRLGWFLSVSSLIAVNYSSRLWTMGTIELKADNQALATGYNIVCVIIWACAFGWTIVACHYGCAPTLNRWCSTKTNIMLSKASFIIYLSHMLILRAYYGSQYNLIEVSPVTILLTLISLSAISILFGVFLCIAFEGPCLKFQRLILRGIKRERHLPVAGAAYSISLANDMTTIEEKNSLNLGPTSVTLLK